MAFSRLEALIGSAKLDRLRTSKVMVFGLGGVGSYAAEAIARSAVGELILIDPDHVETSNLNRQIEALVSTLGMAKVDAMKSRIEDINPDVVVETFPERLCADNIEAFLDMMPDFIVDCIDDVEAKALLLKRAVERNVRIISAMGFANKFHPEMIRISTLKETSVCPLAKTLRQKLRSMSVNLDIPVVFSEEVPGKVLDGFVKLGSTAFVPASAGLMMASHVIGKLLEGGN